MRAAYKVNYTKGLGIRQEKPANGLRKNKQGVTYLWAHKVSTARVKGEGHGGKGNENGR
jgi:hypothetical protein